MHQFFLESRAIVRITILLLVVVIVAAGCNSSQRFGERKPLGKWYHSFTARYNGYFNANELIDEAELQLIESEELDYNELLPVYPAYSVKNPKSAAANLDKAMEKVSLVVNIHRPSRYEDDSYLLLGKAQMLKQDFEDAEYTFQYSVKDFDPANETARLRRLEKKKIAEGKSKTKKSKTRKTRSTAPSRSKEAAKRKKARDARIKKERSSKKQKGSGRKSSSSKKKSSSKKGKPKSRAEMAKEQRERRMKAEKEEIKKKEDAEKAAADAERKKAEAEAARLAKIEAGKVPKAESAINDGKGLVDPVTGNVGDPNKKGLFVHESSLQDLSYWLARAHISREKYTDAERVLGKLARNGKTFKDVRRKLPAAYADLYIKKGDLPAAAPYLADAIALSKDRQEKAHFSFILGQIQQRTGDTKGAYTSFRRVVKLKPDFEMAFNAELQLATTAYRVGQADATTTIKELRRMSKEEKYDEYRDQIFYQMAEIALESGDRPGGIEYLKESLAANLGNQTQAAKGYLRLGNLYFEDESYVLANNYFDSTLQVLPKDDPRFPEIDAYARNLKPIAENLLAIAFQDSLLRIAELSPEEQRELALQMDKDRRQQELEEAIKQSRAAASAPKSTRPAARRAGAGQPESTFFAYDDKALRRSQKAFDRKWGDRSLVDNWRTIDASESAAVLREAEEVAESGVATEEDLAKILEDVPNNAEAKSESEAIIEQALLALGRQYREKLEKPARAAEALEELMRRFPKSENTAEALYLLALAYDEMGETAKARAARERLKKEFPNSKYAKSLIDPAFLDAAKNAEKKLIAYYDQTYDMFEMGNAKGAKQRIEQVPTEFGEDNALQSRFALLNSMVVGKLDGKKPYVAELKKVVSKYPKSEEATRAKEILRLLGERVAGTALDKAAKTGGSKGNTNFTMTPDKSHYFLAVLPKGASMAQCKASVADYNGEFHRLEKLVIGNVYMLADGEQTPVIVIRRFKTQEEGMSYYADVSSKMEQFMDGVEFTGLLISQGNYREVLRSKAFAEYQQFFSENYL